MFKFDSTLCDITLSDLCILPYFFITTHSHKWNRFKQNFIKENTVLPPQVPQQKQVREEVVEEEEDEFNDSVSEILTATLLSPPPMNWENI